MITVSVVAWLITKTWRFPKVSNSQSRMKWSLTPLALGNSGCQIWKIGFQRPSLRSFALKEALLVQTVALLRYSRLPNYRTILINQWHLLGYTTNCINFPIHCVTVWTNDVPFRGSLHSNQPGQFHRNCSFEADNHAKHRMWVCSKSTPTVFPIQLNFPDWIKTQICSHMNQKNGRQNTING